MYLSKQKLYIKACAHKSLQCYIQADTRLLTAAAYGKMQLVQQLLAARADADGKDHQVNHIKGCMHSGLLDTVMPVQTIALNWCLLVFAAPVAMFVW